MGSLAGALTSSTNTSFLKLVESFTVKTDLRSSMNTNYILQVNFLEPRLIFGLSTQGRDRTTEWVTSYKVSYQISGSSWIEMTGDTGTSTVSTDDMYNNGFSEGIFK